MPVRPCSECWITTVSSAFRVREPIRDDVANGVADPAGIDGAEVEHCPQDVGAGNTRAALWSQSFEVSRSVDHEVVEPVESSSRRQSDHVERLVITTRYAPEVGR